jgi:hypothetical protein
MGFVVLDLLLLFTAPMQTPGKEFTAEAQSTPRGEFVVEYS